MNFKIYLNWPRFKNNKKNAFKHKEYYILIQEFAKRIPHPYVISIHKFSSFKANSRNLTFFCDIGNNTKIFCSNVLANKIADHYTSSECDVLIGGPNGWSDYKKPNHAITWKLSELTFPHELACLITVEQLYRATTIINNSSYHK